MLFDFSLMGKMVFNSFLENETRKAGRYASKHGYSLDQVGLTRNRVETDFRDIFQRFGFQA